MLTAVLADLRAAPGVAAVPFLSTSAVSEEAEFRAAVRAVDAALVIAPEISGILEERCRWVEEMGTELLGPSSTAVRLTADKLALASHLNCHQIPTPPTHFWGDPAIDWNRPAILKPRDGAGSQGICLCHERPTNPAAPGEYLVQPLVPGRAASAAFLIGPNGIVSLPPAWQRLSDDGRFRYLGGEVPLPAALAARAERLGRRAVAWVPGLRGYVGVDLVLGDNPDGAGDTVIEINPRLTTSYVGLRALSIGNLAVAMLAVCRGAPAKLHWRPGTLRFAPDGTVTPLQVPRTPPTQDRTPGRSCGSRGAMPRD